MTEERICKKHGKYIPQKFPMLGIVFESNCPECERLQKLNEDQEAEKARKMVREQDMVRRGIEPEFFNATLEAYKPENESECEALKAAQELDNGHIVKFLLLGDNGTGKTMLGSALAIKHKGVRTTMYELSARIRAGYKTGQSELEILNKLLSFPLIVLDEVGRTKGSDAEKNWLSYLIDKAHTRHIKLMIISNRKTAKNLPADRKGEAIEFFFDNDVISRLKQNSKIVEIQGHDRRSAYSAI